jgi:hypothetical protein
MDNRFTHEKTAATAAAARPIAAGEALRENQLAWNARGGLVDGEAIWGACAKAASAYAAGCSGSISITRSVRKRRGSAGARGAG